uniref:Uncharacterized protein n=1 Tax=Romanomermis culicivorax TaxID=13658 RepID=A0A915IIP6_ROMCU
MVNNKILINSSTIRSSKLLIIVYRSDQKYGGPYGYHMASHRNSYGFVNYKFEHEAEFEFLSVMQKDVKIFFNIPDLAQSVRNSPMAGKSSHSDVSLQENAEIIKQTLIRSQNALDAGAMRIDWVLWDDIDNPRSEVLRFEESKR